MTQQTAIVREYIQGFIKRLKQLQRSGVDDGTVAVAIKILFCAHKLALLNTRITSQVLLPGKPITRTQRVLHEIELTRESAKIGTGPSVVETAITNATVNFESGQYLASFLDAANVNSWVTDKFRSATLSFEQFLLDAGYTELDERASRLNEQSDIKSVKQKVLFQDSDYVAALREYNTLLDQHSDKVVAHAERDRQHKLQIAENKTQTDIIKKMASDIMLMLTAGGDVAFLVMDNLTAHGYASYNDVYCTNTPTTQSPHIVHEIYTMSRATIHAGIVASVIHQLKNGIWHLDLNPGNVFVEKALNAQIIDMDLALKIDDVVSLPSLPEALKAWNKNIQVLEKISLVGGSEYPKELWDALGNFAQLECMVRGSSFRRNNSWLVSLMRGGLMHGVGCLPVGVELWPQYNPDFARMIIAQYKKHYAQTKEQKALEVLRTSGAAAARNTVDLVHNTGKFMGKVARGSLDPLKAAGVLAASGIQQGLTLGANAAKTTAQIGWNGAAHLWNSLPNFEFRNPLARQVEYKTGPAISQSPPRQTHAGVGVGVEKGLNFELPNLGRGGKRRTARRVKKNTYRNNRKRHHQSRSKVRSTRRRSGNKKRH